MLSKLIVEMDRVNTMLGRFVAWLLLPMVALVFCIAVLRYFFNLGWVWAQELVVYMHASLFMLTVGYTLSQEGHVRVDIFYREMQPKRRALVNLVGVSLLLLPFCVFVIIYAAPYVWESWNRWEASPEAGGLPLVFLLKTLLVIMPIVLLLQGVVLGLRSLVTLLKE